MSGDKSVKTGMVMAVSMFYIEATLTIVVGYESGHTMVSHQLDDQCWHISYMSQPHSQPVLSLDIDPNFSFYLTSSADAIIAKHPIPQIGNADGTISSAKPSPLAGVFTATGGSSSLSQGLSATPNTRRTQSRKIPQQTTPMKIVQTKHSGQQGLRIRSDSKIFATAGWDTKVRVYSVQTLKELAVLKWHKEGCYALAFAAVRNAVAEVAAESEGKSLIAPMKSLTVKEKRDLKATTTHWIAAGSKDGKVSLWDIY